MAQAFCMACGQDPEEHTEEQKDFCGVVNQAWQAEARQRMGFQMLSNPNISSNQFGEDR